MSPNKPLDRVQAQALGCLPGWGSVTKSTAPGSSEDHIVAEYTKYALGAGVPAASDCCGAHTLTVDHTTVKDDDALLHGVQQRLVQRVARAEHDGAARACREGCQSQQYLAAASPGHAATTPDAAGVSSQHRSRFAPSKEQSVYLLSMICALHTVYFLLTIYTNVGKHVDGERRV